MLDKFSEDDLFNLFSYLSQKTCFDIGDYLHEMLNPGFWEKQENYHQFVVCCFSSESGN